MKKTITNTELSGLTMELYLLLHAGVGVGDALALLEQEETVDRILKEFGLHGRESHIVNGHVPVEQIHGESPIKCGGRLLIIDGGFSKAYQDKTGIAGYTLDRKSVV